MVTDADFHRLGNAEANPEAERKGPWALRSLALVGISAFLFAASLFFIASAIQTNPAAGTSGSADVLVEEAKTCSACKASDISLTCRACYNNLSIKSFCYSCRHDGLNDIGCRACLLVDGAPEVLVGMRMGDDADEHGCKPSTGYKWCEASSACVRPWEHGLKTAEDFTDACANSKQCSCPPSLALYSCTQKQYDSIVSGEECPYYREKTHQCNCPPTEVLYPCTQHEYDDIVSGKKCPFYLNKGRDREDAKSHQCNCPPTEVLYPCTQHEYNDILSGKTCPFYEHHGQGREVALRR